MKRKHSKTSIPLMPLPADSPPRFGVGSLRSEIKGIEAEAWIQAQEHARKLVQLKLQELADRTGEVSPPQPPTDH